MNFFKVIHLLHLTAGFVVAEWHQKIYRSGNISLSSSVARPICQEGQSEKTFPIFAFPSRFFLFSWFFPLFPDFWQIFRCLPPFPPLTSPLSSSSLIRKGRPTSWTVIRGPSLKLVFTTHFWCHSKTGKPEVRWRWVTLKMFVAHDHDDRQNCLVRVKSVLVLFYFEIFLRFFYSHFTIKMYREKYMCLVQDFEKWHGEDKEAQVIAKLDTFSRENLNIIYS